MARYTPGRMVVSSGCIVCTPDGKVLANCIPLGVPELDVPLEQARANTRLFATAPRLLVALKKMLKVQEALMPGLRHISVPDYALINEAPIEARAAIAYAEGNPIPQCECEHPYGIPVDWNVCPFCGGELVRRKRPATKEISP